MRRVRVLQASQLQEGDILLGESNNPTEYGDGLRITSIERDGSFLRVTGVVTHEFMLHRGTSVYVGDDVPS